ncbi:MAG TPA: response regulator [Thermoanaerobaculia bacterium]|nr:response regulator [Thermoanaerobaculia bacterium]
MSLLGRLEDLSLPDIVQIVFLSRRTGVLEIIDGRGRHTVIFRQGMIVTASSPAIPDLGAYLLSSGVVEEKMMSVARQAEQSGVPIGSALLEMNVLSVEDLAKSLREMIQTVVTPLLTSRDGEFNFILSDAISPLEMEYEPERLFKEGGIAPSRILGTEGEKIKPLKGLEESMRAGKELLRGASASPAPSSSPDSPRPRPPVVESPSLVQAEEPDFTAVDEDPFDMAASSSDAEPSALDSLIKGEDEHELSPTVEQPLPEGFGAAPVEAEPFETPKEVAPIAPAPPPAKSRVRITEAKVVPGAPFERNILLFQRDPLVRVAAKRAFARKGMSLFQFGSIQDTRSAAGELLRQNKFFVSFLDLSAEGDETMQLMQGIKKRNHRLPVVVVDAEADLRLRHNLLKAGADLYLTKPSEAHLHPSLVEEQLSMFSDELVLFAERAFEDWKRLTGDTSLEDAGKAIYEIADNEKKNRGLNVLKQLINELTNPNDMSQVSAIILRLAAEYIDRGLLFAAGTVHFVGLGGFGITGDGHDLSERARRLRLPRHEPGVLEDVFMLRNPHRGKLRRLPGNVRLLESLGTAHPTEVVVLPLTDKDQIVGVLYGDNAEHRAPIDSTEGLEIFLAEAGFALHNALIANRGRHALD